MNLIPLTFEWNLSCGCVGRQHTMDAKICMSEAIFTARFIEKRSFKQTLMFTSRSNNYHVSVAIWLRAKTKNR